MELLIRFLGGLAAIVLGGSLIASALNRLRKVYVAFDYEKDRRYKFLLQAWNANKEFEFKWEDASAQEVQSNDIGRIKAALAAKIAECDVLLVIIGAEANRVHPDTAKIGYRNWINWEIAKARELRKRIVAVKIERHYQSPEQLEGAGVSWAMSFTDEAVSKALREA